VCQPDPLPAQALPQSAIPHPNFQSSQFLQQHVRDALAFYDGRCVDPKGGFFQHFKDDGSVFDHRSRHLVSSTRFVFVFAMAARHFPAHPRAAAWQEAAAHGLRFIEKAHRDAGTGASAWTVDFNDGSATPTDRTEHAYGLAFVLLAAAHAALAGVAGAPQVLQATWQRLEQRFWEPQHSLYADETTPQGQLSGYRGQNVNMHVCEASIAAFEATGDGRFLNRAETLANTVTRGLADRDTGLIWEHYHADWTPDWDYNRGDSRNIFKPWGYQPGHLAEWAKFLLVLDRLRPAPWRVERACALFEAAMNRGWDVRHGGLVYGFAPDGSVCFPQKYHWVQAESLAAAAWLACSTGMPRYWAQYRQLWAYAWRHFVDHRHGAWFRILDADNGKLTDEKSIAGKTDYHTMGACYDVLRAMRQSEPFAAAPA
jgi:mannose/cellobiose epimerase-like protein (N-acyl-D-glucosamine 2-epimerase family)